MSVARGEAVGAVYCLSSHSQSLECCIMHADDQHMELSIAGSLTA
jgi:hypothetical protein